MVVSPGISLALSDEAPDIVQRLLTSLESVLEGHAVAHAQNIAVADGRALDALLTLDVKGQPLRVAVEVLRQAYPRDVRDAIWTLDEFLLSEEGAYADNVVRMVAADTLSAGAKELLRRRGCGYFDRDGNLYLRHKTWVIDIQRPSQWRPQPGAVDLFTGAREGVVHALLKMHGHSLTGAELAEMAETSQYTCSVVLQELERREWVEATGSGRFLLRRLIKPGQLLDAWADVWTQRREQRSKWFAFVPRPAGLAHHIASGLAGASYRWSFTGAAAGNAVAPLLTHVETVDLVVPKGMSSEIARHLQLKPADKGANLTLIERDGARMLFTQWHPPAFFASNYVLYLDLLDGKGRNKELAEHLRAGLLDI